jgi:hypothetical protein
MKVLPLLACCCLFLGCASPDRFAVFEGGRVVEGTGGAHHSVKGIDIWTGGSPPRKYKVIGLIEDVRHRSLLGMSGFGKDLAYAARLHGGDAVIILNSRNEFWGFVMAGDRPIARWNHITKASLIQYVN